MKIAPFSRSTMLMATMAALMSSGMSAMSAAIQSGANMYRSRGKGRGRVSGLSRSWNKRGKTYPFSSAKQHAKTRDREYNAVVNGFQIMQTLPSYSRDFSRPDAG